MGGVRAGVVSGGGLLPVPRSKFGCPAVPVRAIARPRLAEVLDQPDWRVALVTGGPATGKTVAVAQWFRTLDPIAREWVTLDAHDDRPERFWLTFVLALERAVPGAFAPAAAAATDVHRLPPEFLGRLLTAWSPSRIRWSSCSTTCISCGARRSPRISASSSSTFPDAQGCC